MTKAKHTSGPWQVGSSSGHNACHVYDGDDDSICTVYGIFAHQSVEQVEHDKRCEEGMANASLIAAAPDMLAALRQWKAAETMKDFDELRNAKTSRDEAIAKATGAA